MKYPLVTIGIPTYNRANGYLKEAIQSALDQTYDDIEVFISDNCSTDHTERLVKSFVDLRIRYIKHQNNIGANNNFNYCLTNAKGDYFLLLHDDDLIDKDFVEICIRSAKYRKDIGIIRTGMRRIDAKGNVIGEKENLVGELPLEDFFLGWFYGKTPMHLCSTLFNTKRLVEIGGFQSKNNLFQDVLAQVILAAKYERIDVHYIKASFRNHPGQNTNAAKVKEWCEDSLILLDTICNLVPKNNEVLKNIGFKFFLKHNYNIARNIKSPLQRFIAHLVIFKMFGHDISYIGYITKKQLKRIKNLA